MVRKYQMDKDKVIFAQLLQEVIAIAVWLWAPNKETFSTRFHSTDVTRQKVDGHLHWINIVQFRRILD